MGNLQQTIRSLAEKFATDLLSAVQTASLDELVAERTGAPVAAPRATPSTRARSAGLSVEAIVAVLKQHKDGLRSDHLRRALGGVKRGAWRYAIDKAIAERKISMRGTKNSAVYSAA